MDTPRAPRSGPFPNATHRRPPAPLLAAGALALLATAVQSAGPGTRAPRRRDFTWLRTLTPDLNPVWGMDEAQALAFDGEGNVLAAGQRTHPEDPQRTNFTVAKWSSRGELRWTRSLSDPALEFGTAEAVVATPDGGVVAAGQLRDFLGDNVILVAKWSAGGEQQWVRRLEPSSYLAAHRRLVAVDPAGDVFAAGSSFTDATSSDVALFKLRGADGETLWSRHIDGTERSFDAPNALVLNGAGDLYIGGEIGNATQSACAVMKVRGSDGERLWTNSLDRPNAFGGGEQVRSVALTSTGDVVACGTAFGGFATGQDFLVGRFDGETGNKEWQYFTDISGGSGNDEGLAVAVDSQDNVLAAGNSPAAGDNYPLLVKLAGSNGLEQWRGRLPMPTVNPDFNSVAALDLAVDDRDHAFVLCQEFGLADPFDGLMGEWNSEGTFVAVRALPEVASGSAEQPRTLAVDARGNLAVGGEAEGQFAVAYCASGRSERLVVTPARLNFARVTVGETQSRSFLIRNTGTAPLSGKLSSPDPQFRLTGLSGPSDTLTFRIPARSSLRVFVRFAPNAAGRRSAALTLASTDPRRPAVRLPLAGIGKPAPAPDRRSAARRSGAEVAGR